jgi:hypothetical protein
MTRSERSAVSVFKHLRCQSGINPLIEPQREFARVSNSREPRQCVACGVQFIPGRGKIYLVVLHLRPPFIGSSVPMAAVMSALALIGVAGSVEASIRALPRHWPNIRRRPGLSRCCSTYGLVVREQTAAGLNNIISIGCGPGTQYTAST